MPFRLDVMGNCDLRSDDEVRVHSVLQQPRRLALLLYLVLESRRHPITRESVLGVFWPDSTPQKARGSLNQAVFKLRRSLGPEVIESFTADELMINQDAVRCDALAFLDSMESGRWDEAVSLYAGDLVPGFNMGNATGAFDHWLDRKRDEMRRYASEAAWQVAEQAEGEGNLPEAALWARRAAEWSGKDEIQIRRLMLTLDRMNDRAGVLAAYETLEVTLRSLDIQPATETRQLLQDLKEQWEEEPDSCSEATEPQVQAPGGKSHKWQDRESAFTFQRVSEPAKNRRLSTAAAAGFLIVLLILVPSGLRKSDPALEAPVTLLIGHFDVLDLGNGMPALLKAALGRELQKAGGLRVAISSEPSTQEEEFVISGVIARNSTELQVNAHLTRGGADQLVRSLQIEAPAGDIVEGIDSAAKEIAKFARREIGLALKAEQLQRSQVSPKAMAMFKLAQESRRHGHAFMASNMVAESRHSFQKSDSLLQRVTETAPGWTMPFHERALTAHGLSWLEYEHVGADSAQAIARHAVQYADEALRRDPTDADALETRAELLHWLWTITKRNPPPDHSELLIQMEQDARQVTEQEPARTQGWNMLGAAAWARGNFADAHWALTNARATDTYLQADLSIILRLFRSSWEIGDLASATNWCDELSRLITSGYLPYYCNLMLLASAPKENISEVEKKLAMAHADGLEQPSLAKLNLIAAVAYAQEGDREMALSLLEKEKPAESNSDRDHMAFTAWAWLSVGDTTRAQRLLSAVAGDHPETVKSILRSRRFEGLLVH